MKIRNTLSYSRHTQGERVHSLGDHSEIQTALRRNQKDGLKPGKEDLTVMHSTLKFEQKLWTFRVLLADLRQPTVWVAGIHLP